MRMIIAVGRDADDTLTNLYTGYDFHAAKAAPAQAKPHIGYVFRGDPSTAALVALRQRVDNPPEPPANGVPVIADISPSSVPAGATDTTATINGENFEQGMAPYYGDQPRICLEFRQLLLSCIQSEKGVGSRSAWRNRPDCCQSPGLTRRLGSHRVITTKPGISEGGEIYCCRSFKPVSG